MKNLKKLHFLLLFSFCFLFLQAQEEGEKLFSKATGFGGFGGLSMNYSTSDHYNISGEGAFSFKNFYLGGFGNSSDFGQRTSANNNYSYELFGHEGGLILGAISNQSNLFALFTELRVAWGRVQAKRELGNNIFEEFDEQFTSLYPKLGLAITPIPIMQVRLFTGYHYAGEFDLNGIDTSFLNAMQFGLSLYLGSF